MLAVRTGCTTAFVEKKRTVPADGATEEMLPSVSFQLDAAFMSELRFPQTSISKAIAGSTAATRTETRSTRCFMV